MAEVALANPLQVRAISHAKVKSDRFDARTLAELFGAGVLPTVWVEDEQTRCLRRLTSRRSQLVRQRTRVKNEITAVLVRNLAGRPPASDLFGKRGRAWLQTLELPGDERQTADACLRQVDFLTEEIAAVDRHVLVEAAWAAIKTPGPLRAFYQRIRARRGSQIAIVAVARKIAALSWQLLTKHEDYAFKRQSLVEKKLRNVELRAGAPRRQTTRRGEITGRDRAQQERQLTQQAEQAYPRLVNDWKASRPAKDGAGAAPGRAPQRPPKDKAARQAPAPTPTLSLADHPHHPQEPHPDPSRANDS